VPEAQGKPIALASTDLEALKGEAYKAMVDHRAGWAYFIIDGVRCPVSMPTQVFKLRMPDGTETELRDPAPAVYADDGSFRALTSIGPPE
jgi:hypothetical protein